MQKRTEPPEKRNAPFEQGRGILDGLVSLIPAVGGPLTIWGRTFLPSQQDKAVKRWRANITESHNETIDRLDGLADAQTETREVVASHEQQLVDMRGGMRKVELADDHYTIELDNYRRLINERKPTFALTLLEAQYGAGRPNANAEAAIVARAKALMAFCHHHLGENDQAHARFEEAYELDPDNPKNVANRTLGLLLVDKADEAYAFADSNFEQDPTNTALAAHLIQAHSHAGAEGIPWEHMSPAVRQDEAVMMARMQWLRGKSDEGWIEQARTAASLFPDNSVARIFAAEAVLEEVLAACRAQNRFLRADEAKRVSEAAATLAEEWEKTKALERKIADTECSTLHNALFGYLIAGSHGNALSLARTSTHLLEGRPYLRKIVAMLALERHDADLIDHALAERFDGDVDLRLERDLQRKDWRAAQATIESEREVLLKAGAPSLDTLAACLKLLELDAAERERGFRELAEAKGTSSHALLLVGQFAGHAGLAEIARGAIERAAETLEADAPLDLRSQVARQAYLLDAWEAVITVLYARVDPASDTPARRWLASAFAAATPRQKADAFFQEARKAGVDDFAIHAAEGQYQFNRGQLDLAASSFRRALELGPESIQTVLALWQTLKRSRKEAAANDLIKSLNPSTFEGRAVDKMDLAQVMWRHGRQDALDFAYDVAVMNANDPDALIKYAGLFFPFLRPDGELPLPNADAVAENVWVRMRNQDDQEMTFVVSAQADLRGRHLPLTHGLVSAALGKAKGETFSASYGPVTTEWRVEELKPKHLALFHDLLSTFEHRFPGHSPFYSRTIRGDDLTPIFEQVKARGKHVAQIFDDYKSNALPLGFSANVGGGSAIDFAVSLARGGRSVMTATGFPDEANAEARLARQAAETGRVVLDAYTVWFLSTTGILETAKRLFGNLLVPRSALDDVERLIEEAGTGARFSLAWDGKNYLRAEISEVDAERGRIELERVRDEIERLCAISGIEIGDDLPAELLAILPLTKGALDGAVVAHREGASLLTADLHMRGWAHDLFKAPTFGLKGVLELARARREIDDKRLAEIAVDMAFHAHNHIDVNSHLLSVILDNDGTTELTRLQVVARYIGDRDADYDSHIDVVASFIMLQLCRLVTDTRVQHAVSILLRAITRLDVRSPEGIVTDIYHRSGAIPQFGRYAVGWLKGHFLLDNTIKDDAK